MTSIQTNILLGQLLTRSIQISDECEMLADYLSFRAEIAKRKRMISRGVNVLIGGLAFAAAYIQPLPKFLEIPVSK